MAVNRDGDVGVEVVYGGRGDMLEAGVWDELGVIRARVFEFIGCCISALPCLEIHKSKVCPTSGPAQRSSKTQVLVSL